MSTTGSAATRLVSRILRTLLPGPIGEEARRDLELEYSWRRARRGGLAAGMWYFANLLRPSTWSLARALRRDSRRAGSRRNRPALEARTGIGISWLDVKLGLRMLVKYPVMTLVSGLAISVTIAVGIGTFSVFQDFFMRPTVPLPEGERIVSLGLVNTETNRSEWRLLHDFEVWRTELRTVEQLSIWRADARNIIGADGRGELAPFAMMSASGFEVARVPPLLGRALLESDEVEGAPPVVVLSHREWTSRFGGDPAMVGRQMRIDRDEHTIVGVMPEGFAFPLSHRMWIPFRDDPDAYPLLEAPRSYVFGRLAPGVTTEEAQAELALIASRRASAHPDTHGPLRGLIMSYTDPHTGMDNTQEGDQLFVRIVLAVLTLLVLIPFANVAILVYARTATRAGEIAVRTAIGASRRRIVAQLFVEALVLSTVSAAAGVGLALFALGRVDRFIDVYLSANMPFWAKNGNDPWAIGYAVGLTVLAAVVAGVVPGLQATGKGVQANLRAAGTNGMRLGRVWTGLVVTQVAITVAFLPLAGSVAWQAVGIGTARPTFAADEYLGAMVSGSAARALGDRESGGNEGAVTSLEELRRRLEADLRVGGVGLATRMPGDPFTADVRIEVEGIAPHPSGRGHPVGRMAASENLFDVLDVPVVTGRRLERPDAETETAATPVVVDRTFVRGVLGGANPIGRRIREVRATTDEPAPWREIVGVVDNLVENPMHPDDVEGMIFTSLAPIEIAEGVRLIVRVPSSPNGFAPELQRIATEVDPTLRLFMIRPLSGLGDPLATAMLGFAMGLGVVLLSVLLLSSAGVFSLISFNVTQRRREIGIRSALGARPGRVLAGVMARSARQLGIGVAVGLVLAAAVPDFSLDGLPVAIDPRLIVAVAALMVVVGLLAAAGPARIGLRVQPTEALKEG